jgi:hypothetical protein
MARWLLAFCLALVACAGERDTLGARNPGDRCIDTCPAGMACTGTSNFHHKPTPGRCELLPGRCMSDDDCRRSQRCARTSAAVGLCGEAPRL